MFDTYAAAKALRNAGFDEPQAEAAVAMVRDAVSEGVATGEDAARLEGKVESETARLEDKVDAGLAEVKTDVARIEGRVESEIGRLETHPTVRMYGGSIDTAAVVVRAVPTDVVTPPIPRLRPRTRHILPLRLAQQAIRLPVSRESHATQDCASSQLTLTTGRRPRPQPSSFGR